MDEPFDTAGVRARVLAGWTASPERFREDANAEEDYALGGYRDRLVVELAQNAADAALRAGVPGRLRLTLDTAGADAGADAGTSTGTAGPGVLIAANVGAALDAAGVLAASTLRASAKRDGAATGRFGVGFAAVLAVTDSPSIVSTSGAVGWSRVASEELVAAVPELAAERVARGGHVPVLRLPFPAAGDPPRGYDTAVRLPLRDTAAQATVRRLLGELDGSLLLLLPGLAEVEVVVDGRVRRVAAHPAPGAPELTVIVDDGATSRWRVVRTGGVLGADVLADRPAEERARRAWSLLWAVPVDAAGAPVPLEGLAQVIRAPTPTDEPLSLPAVLAASFPVDPTRRHIAPGALTDFLVDRAAAAYALLAADLPATPGLLALVPTRLAAGTLDAALRAAVLDRLAGAELLPAAEDPELRLRPRDALAVDDALVPVLAAVVPGVIAAGFTGGDREAALAVLGVARPELPRIVDALATVDRPPRWWHDLYAALAVAVPAGSAREPLGALPVPLADGRLAVGPRGLMLPAAPELLAAAGALGLRVVHPDAAHELLTALGATEANPAALLGEPRVRAAVEASFDSDGPEPLAAAVLALVALARPLPGELPWLAELALPGADGELYPAGELLLPGGVLAGLVEDSAPFGLPDPELLDRWGADVLRAVGVLDSFAVLRELDPLGPEHDLDDEAAWWAQLPTGAAPEELVAVRDLELVREGAWDRALAELAVSPYRNVVVDPAVVAAPDGRRHRVGSYSAWWLARHPVLGGAAPASLRSADADPRLRGLYDLAPGGLDPAFLAALGVLVDLEDADPADVLDRLADPARSCGREQLTALYGWLADREPELPGGPSRVRGVRDAELVVVDAAEAVVLDRPDLLGLLGRRAVAPVRLSAAPALSRLLDLARASELAVFPVLSAGVALSDHVRHDPLLVADADGRPTPVTWRELDGVLHVDAGAVAFGLGRARAWAAGDWSRRHVLTEELRSPALATLLAAEADLDDDAERSD